MIIKLNTADFSDNNIGQITLPAELHPFTKNIFSKCTRFSAYSIQAQAVNNFINTLDEQGILEHLGMFIAPWLASDINEATFDIVSKAALTHGPGVTYDENGKIKFSNNYNTIHLPQAATPTVNFFGAVIDYCSASNYYPIFQNSSNKPTLIGKVDTNQTCIADAFNFNSGGGYKINTNAGAAVKGSLWNITELSNLEQGSTTYNGYPVAVSGSYSKANEPFNNTIANFTCGLSNTLIRAIFFAGDGTILSSTQLAALISAMNTLRAAITEV